MTRDDPNAAQIQDARIRQLPTWAQLHGIKKHNIAQRQEDDGKMTREDFQILMYVSMSTSCLLFPLTTADDDVLRCRLFIGGLVILIAFIMAITFGSVWYFTKYENNAFERNVKIFLEWLEKWVDAGIDVFNNTKNRLIKSEL